MTELGLASIPYESYDSIRKGFGRGLLRAGENAHVVALSADLTGSLHMDAFRDTYPDRFFEVGIAEQNMVTVAAGLAMQGKVPFCGSYAIFSPGRNWEQIRTTICLNNLPVKIVGSHAGLLTGPDGATHQMLEDIALMRVMPEMVVIVPGDALEAEKAIVSMAQDLRPTYIRLSRSDSPIITTPDTPFDIGSAYLYRTGDDLTIISCGPMTALAMEAALVLSRDGIEAEVLHCPTIKPLDAESILASVKKTGRVITCEDAQVSGGLGGAVAELLCEYQPVPMRRIGVRDKFGESGEPSELYEAYGLTARHITLTAHELVHDQAEGVTHVARA